MFVLLAITGVLLGGHKVSIAISVISYFSEEEPYILEVMNGK